MTTRTENPPSRTPSVAARRLLAPLLALVLVSALGGWQFLRSRGYHEYRLRRMGAAELHAWTKDHPGDAPAHYYLGLVEERSGDAGRAAGEYGKALDLDPAFSRARARLAARFAAGGQDRAAEALLQQGVQLDPTVAELHRGLGRICAGRQELRRAAYEWQLAASLEPNEAEAWLHLGDCWMGLGDEGRALPPYERAVERAPLSAACQKALAGALRLRGRYAEAERRCRHALFLRPDDAQAYFQLMKIVRDRDGPTPEAEESMRRAVALDPDNPQLRYYLATICQERGKPDAAAEFATTQRLLRAQQPRPAAPWADWQLWLSYLEGAHFNLAKIAQGKGRAESAAAHLAEFHRLSDYHVRANQLMARAANRPNDAAVRSQLARLHAAAGFPHLAKKQPIRAEPQ